MACTNARCIEEINNEQENVYELENSWWINDNRILLSILFGCSGMLFFLLFLDSHYKNMFAAKNQMMVDAEFGSKIKAQFGKILKKKSG